MHVSHHIKTWICLTCGKSVTELDGERVEFCDCEKKREKGGKVKKNNEKCL